MEQYRIIDSIKIDGKAIHTLWVEQYIYDWLQETFIVGDDFKITKPIPLSGWNITTNDKVLSMLVLKWPPISTNNYVQYRIWPTSTD
jgi:hypothetical protein